MNVKSWQSSNDLATLNVVAQFQEGSCSYFDLQGAVLSLSWKSPYVDKTVFILRRGPGAV